MTTNEAIAYLTMKRREDLSLYAYEAYSMAIDALKQSEQMKGDFNNENR